MSYEVYFEELVKVKLSKVAILHLHENTFEVLKWDQLN